MVEQARRVHPMRMTVAVLTLLIMLLQPALSCITGNSRLLAAEPAATAEPTALKESQEALQPENESPEDLITTTEMMIEKLILQMDRELQESSPAKSEKGYARSILASLPSIKPIIGSVTSAFGMRMHPVFKRPVFHAGIDFSAPEGTKVLSTAGGIVVSSGFDSGYGKKVIIDHGLGFQTIYAHLSKAVVRQGQHVKRGEIIAFSGNTGRSTGPHLHYEVRKDNLVVNPTAYFPDESPDKFMTLQDIQQAQDNSHS